MNDFNIACFLSFGNTQDLDITAMQFEISRASVINNIKRIEKDLGVTLVSFSSSTPFLTYAGTRFFEFFSSFERGLADSRKLFPQSAEASTLTVVISEFISSPPWITQAVSEFSRLHPEIEVLTRQASPKKTIELMQSEQADIALCSRYLARAISVPCQVTALEELPLCLIVAEDSAYANMSLHDLSVYGIPLYGTFGGEASDSEVLRRMEKECLRVGFRPRPYIVLDNLDSVYITVRYGNGIAFSTLNDKLMHAGIFHWTDLPFTVTLATAKLQNNATKPIVTEFESFLAERKVRAI